MQLVTGQLLPNIAAALAYQSVSIFPASATEVIHLNVKRLDAGQTIYVRIIAVDDNGVGYNYGNARAVISATGQYTYLMGTYTATGGSIPADGEIGLPAPGQYQVWIYATDTSASKSVVFDLCVEDRRN